MNKSFGKGLESLIPKKKAKEEPAQEAKKEAIFSIEVEKIKPNPYQPRKEFDSDGLKALAESIREHGILQPILVARTGDGSFPEYQIIAGERRLLAARLAGLVQVPVIIKDPSDKDKLVVSLVENVQRIDLNPMEKAEAFKRLQEEFGFTQKEVADICGKSREAVANTVRLLELPEEVKDGVRGGKISEGHARVILMAKEPQIQKAVFANIIKDGLSVHGAETLVHKFSVWQPKKRTIQFIEEFKEFEDKLKEAIGINTLKFGTEAGQPKLTIFFKTKKEIESLIKRFS
ncbi:MAG: ParB/RepB/Spo0J family partition protein [Candidatus Nealsonbacteria bacterium]|nr:ParB/RepB/Spo0J family partition protein [Candidatus Nealsonbacteria bacterium]